MLSNKKNILIIGAGIHGLTLSFELAEDHNVFIIDENPDIFMGSSQGTHNRIHLGYHYPRSIETIIECQNGYDVFFKKYRNCLVFPDFYYAIEKNSLITSSTYKKVMESQNLPCESNFPEKKFLNTEYIEDCFKVKEACFDIEKLKEKFKKEIEILGINLILDFKLESVIRDGKKLTLNAEDKTFDLDVDLVLNCTYTFSNNILKIFGIDNYTEYEFEETEICVMRSDLNIPALTVMDGPFISILPYGEKKGLYIIYDVVNSVRNRAFGHFFEKSDLTQKSNLELILSHGKKYYPFFDDLKYSHSIYSHRPIPINIQGDSRATRIIKEDYPIDFYSIKEGKFISAPSVATEFIKIFKN